MKIEIENGKKDVIEFILRDHKPLKKLIKTLKDRDIIRADKENSYEEFAILLMVHAKAEEKSLYVEMKGIKKLRGPSFEGDTEHKIAEQLLHEINAAAYDDEWSAKVKMLAELIENHIQEEEDEILPDVEERMDLCLRVAIGEVYTQIKTEFEVLVVPHKNQTWRENVAHLV